VSGPLHSFDRPNSYIGRSVERPDAKRLVEGHRLTRMLALVLSMFVRQSGYAGCWQCMWVMTLMRMLKAMSAR